MKSIDHCTECRKPVDARGSLRRWNDTLQAATLTDIRAALDRSDLLDIEDHVEKHAIPPAMLEQLARENDTMWTALAIPGIVAHPDLAHPVPEFK